jgi:hypothetical protein
MSSTKTPKAYPPSSGSNPVIAPPVPRNDEGDEREPIEGNMQRILNRQRKMEKLMSGEKLIKTKVTFFWFFSIEDLLSGNPQLYTHAVAQNENIWQAFALDPKTGAMTYKGDPTRSIIRHIREKGKSNSAPFGLSYNINLLAGQSVEALNAQTKRTSWINGTQVLGSLEPEQSWISCGKKHKHNASLLFENSEDVDPELFQTYGPITEEDLTKGLTIYKAGQEEDTEENRKLWTASFVIKGEGKNPVIVRLLHRNQKDLNRLFGVNYTALMEQSNKNGKAFITIPYTMAMALLDHGRRDGFATIQRHTKNLMETAVALGHPHSGKYADFSGFEEYLKQCLGDNLEAYRRQRYCAKVKLGFTYALPGFQETVTKQ